MVSKQVLLSSSFDLQLRGRSDRLVQTKKMKNVIQISCCSSHSHYPHIKVDHYKILGIHPWASMPQVKKAFRKLAKQYHPDVCKGKNSSVQFEEINAAYEAIMADLRGESSAYGSYGNYNANNEETIGMKNDPFSAFHDGSNDHKKGRTDQQWDYGDEWIGWEVGNWMFYQDQQETDVMSSIEEI